MLEQELLSKPGKNRRAHGLGREGLSAGVGTCELNRCHRIIWGGWALAGSLCVLDTLRGNLPGSIGPHLSERLSNLQVLRGQQHVGCAPTVSVGAGSPHHSSSGRGKCPMETHWWSLLPFLPPSPWNHFSLFQTHFQHLQ